MHAIVIAIIINRLLYLWNSSGIMTWLMATGFVVMHALMVGFAAAAAKVLRGISVRLFCSLLTVSTTDTVTHVGSGRYQSCYINEKPAEFKGIYISYVRIKF